MKTYFYIAITALLFLSACSDYNYISGLSPDSFSAKIDNKEVKLYTLKNNTGIEMAVCNYGGKIVSLYTKDKYGKYDDIVLGYDSLADYLNPAKKMTGSVVGRVAGRINGGHFEIDGKEYQLDHVNERNFHSHGGLKGFDKVVWEVIDHRENAITLKYVSADGEEGYPGTLTTIMKYEVTDKDVFRVEYHGTTDKPTPVNLTHHSFFNLAGAGNGSVENHVLKINAARYLPLLPTTINTGEILPVKDTPLDFTAYRRIGDSINSSFKQIQIAKGYDHTWVINNTHSELSFAASIYDPGSGRKMDVFTDQPCLHFYTSKMSSSKTGKKGKEYGNRSGFCMETMHYPDAMNQPDFPTFYLYPGDTYHHICEFRFSVIE